MRRTSCVPIEYARERGFLSLMSRMMKSHTHTHTRDTPPVYVNFSLCVASPVEGFLFSKKGMFTWSRIFLSTFSPWVLSLSPPYTWETSAKARQHKTYFLVFHSRPKSQIISSSSSSFRPRRQHFLVPRPLIISLMNQLEPFIIWYSN